MRGSNRMNELTARRFLRYAADRSKQGAGPATIATIAARDRPPSAAVGRSADIAATRAIASAWAAVSCSSSAGAAAWARGSSAPAGAGSATAGAGGRVSRRDPGVQATTASSASGPKRGSVSARARNRSRVRRLCWRTLAGFMP